ncbi:hypothetical protein C8258_18750 [Nocardia sp. MDA0666]|nr:hypothetical protein C8258_18750 [Nocardia sp. MDA0666]
MGQSLPPMLLVSLLSVVTAVQRSAARGLSGLRSRRATPVAAQRDRIRRAVDPAIPVASANSAALVPG